jgi:hypothetical protein
MKPCNHDIRLALPAHVEALPEIERLAGLLYKTYPEDLGIPDEVFATPNSIDNLAAAQREGRLWVALNPSGNPVGFALVLNLQGYAHLEELMSSLHTDARELVRRCLPQCVHGRPTADIRR